jgi:hypothetical protein
MTTGKQSVKEMIWIKIYKLSTTKPAVNFLLWVMVGAVVLSLNSYKNNDWLSPLPIKI